MRRSLLVVLSSLLMPGVLSVQLRGMETEWYQAVDPTCRLFERIFEPIDGFEAIDGFEPMMLTQAGLRDWIECPDALHESLRRALARYR